MTATWPSVRPATVGAGGLADGVGREGDLGAEQLAEARGGGGQREGRVRGALGAAQVRGDDDPRAGFGERGDRRPDCADAAVVGDRGAVQRHVEVGADEYPLARDPFGEKFVDRLHLCSHTPWKDG